MALLVTGCFSIWLLNGFPSIKLTFSEDLVNSKYFFVLSKNDSEVIQPYFSNDLPIADESMLIDIKNFKFTMNHITCNKTPPFLVMLIHSAPANSNKRNVIRQTWGQQMSSIAAFFLIGTSEKYKTELEKEDAQYSDLIQGNFLDSYRNMTYKHVMALKWVTYHCPSKIFCKIFHNYYNYMKNTLFSVTDARYILKLDDDVFVNVLALLEFLNRGLSPWGARRLILCDSISTSKVKRSWRSKWRVSPKEYPGQEYPSYCAGWAILYSPDAVFLLYREAQKEPFFWIDDVHITGTLAKKTNLTQTSIHPMILSENSMKVLLKQSQLRRDFFFGPPNLMENGIRALYSAVTANIII